MNPALDSRARFEAHRLEKTGRKPETWAACCANLNVPLPPAKHHNDYVLGADQAAWEAWQAAIASMAVIDPETGSMAQAYRDLIEGMSVSVDVSTGDDDAGHRYFGTITEVMDDPYDKHHVTLLVQDAAPNFNTNPVLAALAAKETT